MDKFINIFHHFGVKSFVLSMGVGLVAKLFAVIVFALIYFMDKSIPHLDIFSFLQNHTLRRPYVENSPFDWIYSPGQIIVAIIVAPLWENIKIPLFFYITGFVSKSNIYPIFLVVVLEFYLHGMGVYGLSGASGFAVFCVFYSLLYKQIGWQKAFAYTVIAHSSANLFSLGMSFI